MDKEENNEKLSEEDTLLFRTAIKKIQPIKQDKVFLKRKAVTLPRPFVAEETAHQVYLSDHSLEKKVSSEQHLFFARSGLSIKQIKRLKQGKTTIDATLDLHGLDAEGARTKLIQFLEFAYQNNKRCLRIVHGKGHTDKPVLKNKVNNWLRQFDTVLAFCTALPRHGGAGAVYVLLRSKR